ncbi:hypothetical protein I545_6750 [Mycobacterium kansasii 662]|uniref:Uncharacterized protein n=1 Tax=Mycobacterium kansasii 662 TaxID=1299326 RepID=X7XVS5_MYCKA|nr:hypothetical protein [Mycobacterium kansasii]ETZ98705.1 hypothetical protein I545_6750 [Mycobacterium kansasii 662]
MRLGDTLAEKELSPQQQLQLLVELRSGLDEDGDDPSARSDIAQLLRMLRMRHDVTYRTRTEIDNVLAEIGAVEAGPAGASSTPQAKPQPSPVPAAEAASAPSTQSRPSPAQVAPSGANGQSNKRLLVIGGAVVAVVVAVALIAVFATQGGNRKPAARPGSSTAPAAPAPHPASNRCCSAPQKSDRFSATRT